MNNQKWILSLLLAIGLFATVLVSCKKDEPSALTLTALTAGGIDLNGASSATGVPVDAPIIATFSSNVDVATATSTNITLTRDIDGVVLTTTITVSGSTVTINATEGLGSGTLYKISFGAGLKSSDGGLFTATDRSFTSAGTYAPAGVIAFWNFDDGTANAVVGGFDPSESTDASYPDSHNSISGKAASFNGTTTYIEYAGIGPTLLNAHSFSLSFWVYANSVGHVDGSGNPKGNFVMGSGFFKGFQFEIPGDYAWCKLAAQYDCDTVTQGEDIFFNGDGLTKDDIGGWQGCIFNKDLTGSGGVALLLKDTWANVVVQYDGDTKVGSLYINGELMKQQDFNLWPAGSPKLGCIGLMFDPLATDVGTGFVLGFAEDKASTLFSTEPWGNVNSPDSNHFQGMLDDVRVYHRALTADEILLMYNSSK